jgi:hypothetical protein
MTILWTVGLLAVTSAALADDAQDVVSKYAAATAQENWSVAMRLVDPRDLTEVGAYYRKILTSESYASERTKTFKITDEELKQSSDADVVALVFSAAFKEMRRYSAIEALNIDVLGGVPESPELVHFVAKSHGQISGRQITGVSVISARRRDGRWYVVMPDAMRSQAARIAKQFTRPSSGDRPPAPPPPPVPKK